MFETLDHNSYEEARRKRVQENQQKIQELGLLNISKDLGSETNRKSKLQNKARTFKPKPNPLYAIEPRRSSRARNPVNSYVDDFGLDDVTSRKRPRSSSSASSPWRYIARPLEEIKIATYEERAEAMRAAEKLQSELKSGKPSFVKSMVRSHVYSCFWLGLPSWFCEKHLSKLDYNVVLENEDGEEYDAVYMGKRSGLSGGWRAFALLHKLDDGDAVVFELIQPARLKVYIVRASAVTCPGDSGRKEANKRTQRETGEENQKKNLKKEDVKSALHQEEEEDRQEEEPEDDDVPTKETKAAKTAKDGGKRASTRTRKRRVIRI